MKKNLDEVSFMRPILIVLVVLYHAMAIHTGNWDLPEGTPQIGAYAAVGRIAYMFMLEAFVFMSGYVWAFQREQRGAEPFGVLVKKKSYRLLVPCYLFGILYALLFERATPLMENVVRVFTGIGHLWFLVMLFVCFVALWALLKWIPKTRWWGIFLLFAMLALFSSYPQSFRLSNIMYYPLYFFFGYVMYSNREHMMSRTNVGKVLSAWIVFLVLYAGLSYVRGRFMEQADEGDLLEMLKKGCRLCYTIAGVMAFYITSVWVVSKIKLPKWYIDAGAMCFGVYIFQQFILQFLYYHTSLPVLSNPYLLPWEAFTVSLAGSLLLTWLIRKTNLGRKIL